MQGLPVLFSVAGAHSQSIGYEEDGNPLALGVDIDSQRLYNYYMKTCSRCKLEKPIEVFPPMGSGRISAKCRTCKQEYDREYYLQTNELRLARKKVNSKALRKLRREWLWTYLKDHPCVDCGEADPIVLEFDHIDSSLKLFDIGNAIANHSIENLAKEISKCEVRCSNCHKRRTAIQFGWYK